MEYTDFIPVGDQTGSEKAILDYNLEREKLIWNITTQLRSQAAAVYPDLVEVNSPLLSDNSTENKVPYFDSLRGYFQVFSGIYSRVIDEAETNSVNDLEIKEREAFKEKKINDVRKKRYFIEQVARNIDAYPVTKKEIDVALKLIHSYDRFFSNRFKVRIGEESKPLANLDRDEFLKLEFKDKRYSVTDGKVIVLSKPISDLDGLSIEQIQPKLEETPELGKALNAITTFMKYTRVEKFDYSHFIQFQDVFTKVIKVTVAGKAFNSVFDMLNECDITQQLLNSIAKIADNTTNLLDMTNEEAIKWKDKEEIKNLKRAYNMLLEYGIEVRTLTELRFTLKAMTDIFRYQAARYNKDFGYDIAELLSEEGKIKVERKEVSDEEPIPMIIKSKNLGRVEDIQIQNPGVKELFDIVGNVMEQYPSLVITPIPIDRNHSKDFEKEVVINIDNLDKISLITQAKIQKVLQGFRLVDVGGNQIEIQDLLLGDWYLSTGRFVEEFNVEHVDSSDNHLGHTCLIKKFKTSEGITITLNVTMLENSPTPDDFAVFIEKEHKIETPEWIESVMFRQYTRKIYKQEIGQLGEEVMDKIIENPIAKDILTIVARKIGNQVDKYELVTNQKSGVTTIMPVLPEIPIEKTRSRLKRLRFFNWSTFNQASQRTIGNGGLENQLTSILKILYPEYIDEYFQYLIAEMLTN